MSWRSKVPDRKSTRLNSSHLVISYAVFCLKKKKRGYVERSMCCPRTAIRNSSDAFAAILASASLMRFFFFNATATTEIYTLSLHDALPISRGRGVGAPGRHLRIHPHLDAARKRSEEHTSELQSPCNLVCRLLLEKKKA